MNFKLSNGVDMPKIGLGTFQISDMDVEGKVLEAIEMGYRHIDTAQRYENEAGIGRALKKSNIERQSLFITSKQKYHMSMSDAKQAFFESLEKLQTHYIDLFLIHWPNHAHEVNQETWRFFEWLYENNYVRAIGVSNFTIEHMEALLKTAKIKPHVNQVECHPGLTQKPLKAYLDRLNIHMISYGPFMRGSILEAPFVEPLTNIAKTYDITVHQLVIAWGINLGIFMIPKSSNHLRLKQNLDAASIVLLEDDIEKIDALNRGKRVYTDPSNNPWGIFK
jgi:diketogulonate reductase-like aldo/keto reductase